MQALYNTHPVQVARGLGEIIKSIPAAARRLLSPSMLLPWHCQVWPALTCMQANEGDKNGREEWRIVPPRESACLWYHLYRSGLYWLCSRYTFSGCCDWTFLYSLCNRSWASELLACNLDGEEPAASFELLNLWRDVLPAHRVGRNGPVHTDGSAVTRFVL